MSLGTDMRNALRATSVVLCLALAAGCTRPNDDVVTVFAAASLTEAFEAIARDFERAHPGVEVRLNFAGSQSLRTQLENGARADVFASANPAHMRALVEEGLARAPQTFATNALVVTTPADNPAEIGTFSELNRAQSIVLAGEAVPAGVYADRVLKAARGSLGDAFVAEVWEHVVSRENDVRATLQKVVLGEADAAMVYATDARSADLPEVEIPAELNVRAAYPIAPISVRGEDFARFVGSAAAQERLRSLGFGTATDGMSASR
ncbi:MAG: molybdate ABC transporter substrate-binding protein [Myxococcota bacterium]